MHLRPINLKPSHLLLHSLHKSDMSGWTCALVLTNLTSNGGKQIIIKHKPIWRHMTIRYQSTQWTSHLYPKYIPFWKSTQLYIKFIVNVYFIICIVQNNSDIHSYWCILSYSILFILDISCLLKECLIERQNNVYCIFICYFEIKLKNYKIPIKQFNRYIQVNDAYSWYKL